MVMEFSELATPVGLGAAVVAIVALLKRVKYKGIGEFVRYNALVVSIAVAAVLSLGVALIQYFGLTQEASEIWQVLVFMWMASQGVYNAQKGVAEAVNGK